MYTIALYLAQKGGERAWFQLFVPVLNYDRFKHVFISRVVLITPSKSRGRLYMMSLFISAPHCKLAYLHVASLSKSYLGTFGKQPCAVLFIESQQKGQTEVQWNPELPLSIALPVVGFLSTDSMGTCSSTSNQLLDMHEEVFLYAVICCHDKSTDTVTFSIKIRRYECIEVCR